MHDRVSAGLDVITDGEQTRFDFNLSFYGFIEGIVQNALVPRKWGPPAHDQRGKHYHHRRTACPTGPGRGRRVSATDNSLAPAGPVLKASLPGPFTLSGRLLPNDQYPDRYAITEALLPMVQRELEGLGGRRMLRNHR